MSPDDEPIRNLYRPGLRARWRERARHAREGWRVLRADPRGTLRRVPPWAWRELRAGLERDREMARRAGRWTGGKVAAGWRRPGGRRAMLGAAALAGFLVTFSWERCGVTGCPDAGRLVSLQPGGAPVVYDAKGEVLAELAPVRWAVVELEKLPEHVPQAFVAVEDQRFYEHGAVDWKRFLGTTMRNVVPGGRAQGASTITMQLARNVFPERLPASERTVRRKLLEIRVAMEIEERFTKDEILQLYLNQIYFGEGVYGIESAARTYFGKHASQLKLSEAALLAGLPKAPTHYNPRKHRERSLRRRNLVLSLMEAQGRITPEEAEAARRARPRLARWEVERKRRRAPYYVEQVRRVMEDRFGEELYSRSLRIYTPLDPETQRAAEQALERQLGRIEAGEFGRFTGPRKRDFEGGAETPYLQGAAVVMEAETGNVRALVGGRDYTESAFDRMLQGLRQPGSAFKPFVYAAALDAGVAPTERIEDAPLRRELPGGEVWEPRNFDGRFRGPVTVRRSLRQSINTVAVLLAERVGIPRVRAVARRMGIRTEIPELPSVAIGAAAVRPVELAAAYTAFAGLGVRAEPRWVTRVEDPEGEILWESDPRRRRVLDPGVAFLVVDMLRDVVDRGTGSAVREAGFRGPAAGKTGTTNEAADAWFVGFTPRHVGAVWIGFDRPRPIVPEGSGGELAAPVWARILRAAREEPPEHWEPPAAVVERRVVAGEDAVIAPGCRARGESYEEYFLRGAVPPEVCPAGRPYGGGVGGWVRRRLDELGGRMESWAEEQLGEAWGGVVRSLEDLLGGGGGEEPAEAPRPRREEPAPPIRVPELPEVRLPEEVVPELPLPEVRVPEELPLPEGPYPDTLLLGEPPREEPGEGSPEVAREMRFATRSRLASVSGGPLRVRGDAGRPAWSIGPSHAPCTASGCDTASSRPGR